MTGGVGDRADNRDDVSAAVIGRRRRIKGPGSAELDALIGVAASNHRGRRVDYSHLLAALSAVATEVSRLPRPRGIEGSIAMTGGVGDRADNRDNVAAAVVSGCRRIKGPGSAELDALIGVAASTH